MGLITSKLNSVKFEGEFDASSLRRMLATLNNIKKQGFTDVDLSFADLTRAMAPQLLPFAIHCRKLLHEGFEVKLELPREHKLERLFKNTNWAYLIDPRGHAESDYHSQTNMPALLFSDSRAQFKAVDKAVNLLLQTLNISDRRQVQAVEWSVNEIADNVLNHSSSPVGGVIQVTSRATKNLVEFVVADGGQGIPKTLRESHSKMTSDVEALERAIREGITRNTTTNMGNGLFGSYNLAKLSDGKFGIFSGYASLVHDRDLRVTKETVPFTGTVVECSISIANPDLLSEALTFKGKKFSPYSNIDRMDESERIKIMMAEEVESFGSRVAAKPVKTKIANIIATTTSPIEIDLDGVVIITSSFADEVFGKLFVELGPLTFMNRLTLTGGSTVVRQLIDRAISQRMALGPNIN